MRRLTTGFCGQVNVRPSYLPRTTRSAGPAAIQFPCDDSEFGNLFLYIDIGRLEACVPEASLSSLLPERLRDERSNPVPQLVR